MTLRDIRSEYLDFFKRRGHTIIPSASLVPENDPTTLFTGSGMQPLIPYLLGKNHPAGVRLANSQKSFRAMDIEEVGDNRHTTFFEMLGNWSLGDYFKQEQLSWSFEFLTDVVGLEAERLYVTVYAGNEKAGVPRDDESVAIWKKLFAGKGIEANDIELVTEERGAELGMQGGRIFYYGDKNWWSRAGTPEKMPAGEPGGPDSEVFYDFGTPHDPKFGENCHPNCDCGRFLEIGNSVFMEFVKNADGTFGKLPKRNVDFGGGLERIAAASVGNPDIFLIDTLQPLITELVAVSGKDYGDPQYQKSFRVVADHTRAAIFMLGDEILPSHTDRGYVLRRLIRRAIRHLDRLEVDEGMLEKLSELVIHAYRTHYTELETRRSNIRAILREEEGRFRKTLATGLRYMHGMTEFEKMGSTISGTDAFTLFSTYGFPIEIVEEIAKEKGMAVDLNGFRAEMEKHQELSRVGAEQKFKGGLADTAEKTVRLHTAHHLLLRALQNVLGDDVKQRGSNITQERLRIDFSYPQKMTREQLAEVERIVNEKMDEDLPVIRSEMTKDEAEKLGAEHEFGQKYPDMVSVYSVGPKGATAENPQFDQRFSIEFCGGPHASSTGELAEGDKTFKIQKEEAVAAGIRRIKAVLE